MIRISSLTFLENEGHQKSKLSKYENNNSADFDLENQSFANFGIQS